MKGTSIKYFLFMGILPGYLVGCQPESKREFTSWEIYRGDDGSNAYSQLNQIK